VCVCSRHMKRVSRAGWQGSRCAGKGSPEEGDSGGEDPREPRRRKRQRKKSSPGWRLERGVVRQIPVQAGSGEGGREQAGVKPSR